MGEQFKINEAQRAHWNGDAGHAWVQADALFSGMFKPLEALLVEAAVAGSASRVLDVGCGAGSTTLALARALGAGGRCVGLDISGPLIAAARARAQRETIAATFIDADAQTHVFQPDAFDLIVSRFGVMFFEDDVRAFANLRTAATSGAQLLLIAWRDAADNPFMTTAERAAGSLLGCLPARSPNGPGQFGFADSRRVESMLQQSGWSAIEIAPLDVVCTFPEQALIPYLTRVGPLGRVFDRIPEAQRAEVIATVRAAFEPYVHGDEVRFNAACWSIRARS